MIKRMGKLASSVYMIHHNPHTIFHSAGELLKANGVTPSNVRHFVKDLNYSVNDVKREIERRA